MIIMEVVNDIIAVITFLLSSEKRGSINDYIKAGLLLVPFKFGFKAFRNLLKASALLKLLDSAYPLSQSVYLFE